MHRVCAAQTGSPCLFSSDRDAVRKTPLSGKALIPFIDQIKQAAFSRSRRRKAQLAIHAN